MMKLNKTKRTVSLLLAAFLFGLLPGCGSSTEATQAAPEEKAVESAIPSSEAQESTSEPSATLKTRPIAVDENGFTATGREIAEGFVEMLIPGFLFKTVTPIIEKTEINWDEHYNEYQITCGLSEWVGSLSFYNGKAGQFEGRDTIPSDVVVLSFPLPNASQEEMETFTSYARALVYLCSTCKSGMEANDILQAAIRKESTSMTDWVENGAMHYNLLLSTDSDGTSRFFLTIKGPEHDTLVSDANELPLCGAAVDKDGFCVNTGTLFKMIESLVTDPKSDFYGDITPVIKRDNGTCFFQYSDSDAVFSVCPSNKGIDGMLQDDDEFTLIMFICLLPGEHDTSKLMSIGSALLYLTDPELNTASKANDTMVYMLKEMGNWTQKGKMEYAIFADEGMVGMAVREIKYYKD